MSCIKHWILNKNDGCDVRVFIYEAEKFAMAFTHINNFSEGNFMKRLVSAMVALLFACCALAPAAARAAEIKVGAAAMYDWWKPAYLPFEFDAAGGPYGHVNDYSMQGSFMLGPTFRASIEDGWSIGLQGLFGLNKNRFQYSSKGANGYFSLMDLVWPSVFMESGKINSWKCDLDLTGEKVLNKYFNLLVGVRFSYNKSSTNANYFMLGLNSLENNESRAWYFGPTVGIGFNTEIYKGLSVSMGVSALMQGGEYHASKNKPILWMSLVPTVHDYTVSHLDIGPDTFIKLSYFIAPAGLEVWAGGRYICLPHISVQENPSESDLTYKKWLTGKVEHFGGVMFGISYLLKIKS